MTFPAQKTFGEYIAERVGPKWVYANRTTDRLCSRYPDSIVILPKQQHQLAADYKREWGEEYNVPAWKALCALRHVKMELETAGIKGVMVACSASYDSVCEAIEALTT